MQKLKYNEVKEQRELLLKQQNGLCLLCQQAIEAGSAVLDHCHATGQIRAVLHRGCNALLGKVENSLAINRISPSMLAAICSNLVNYVGNLQPLLHPTHKTPEERKQRAKVRAKRRLKK